MKTLKVAKKDLKNLEIEICKKGFALWITEKIKVDGKIKVIRHWLLDGSLIKEDGIINFGNPDIYKINAKYNESENAIFITRD